MERKVRGGENLESVAVLPIAERTLNSRDPVLGLIIASQTGRWPEEPSEDPLWGLLRIVMAQQLSTVVACRLADRVRAEYPHLSRPSSADVPGVGSLRKIGLSERRARCCATIVERSDDIRTMVKNGETWDTALTGIKGVGPWTLRVFRIMVMREPDVLPLGDVGLERAIRNVYGVDARVEELSQNWRPYRSVACWYLWRTLGNKQLG
jgi:DNA-3-methyladenine glycosylase II